MSDQTSDRHTSGDTRASVSTHVLDTSAGRPAAAIGVELSARASPDAAWSVHARAATDADGRCTGLPALPAGTTHARLRFDVGPHLAAASGRSGGVDGGAFFPEVTVAFAVAAGEHYHVPLLLNPFGYSVYRGS
ncbi:hydroxyisourate hydrolase [Streptomyces buecherae]|uniref:hydroxyisourate hydrolase n=1 Tax=Streptomyces buecherae TaxID=2763006 RepID=UPI00369B0C17